MSGKGDTPRPYAVSQQAYYDNWERTFRGAVRVIGSCDHELTDLPLPEDTAALTSLLERDLALTENVEIDHDDTGNQR